MSGVLAQEVLNQLNQAMDVITKEIEVVRNLKPVYKPFEHSKVRRYTVYCPHCLDYQGVSYYSYRKALEGRLLCRCKTPMKPLDDNFKDTKLRRLEMLKDVMDKLSPVILSIFGEDLENWYYANMRDRVIHVMPIKSMRITFYLGPWDYISIYECDAPEIIASFEEGPAYRPTSKIIRFAEELEKLKQTSVFRAAIAVHPYEYRDDRGLLESLGFVVTTHIDVFKCASRDFIPAMMVKLV
jgi:hypothetical protein